MKITPMFARLLAIIALLLVLTACDPISLSTYTVDKVFAHDDNLFARILIGQSWGPGCCFAEDYYLYFVSEKIEKYANWKEIKILPEKVEQEWAKSIIYPKTVCGASHPNVCYRINGEDQIDTSVDAGVSWKKAWKSPPGRKEFLYRNPQNIKIDPVEPHNRIEQDTTPKDIAILENGNEFIVIAAMGNQGVLLQNLQDDWVRIGVAGAIPYPYSISGIKEIDDYLLGEIFIAVCLSFSLLIFFHRFFSRKTPLIFLICFLIPFVLWTFGIIPIYQIALSLAIILGLASLASGYSSRMKKEKTKQTNS